MGDSIWMFLWLIDKTTKEVAGAKGHVTGWVLRGMPISDKYLAQSLKGCCTKTVQRWRKNLVCEGYIEAINTGHGYSYRVLKSKKYWPKKPVETGHKSPPGVDTDVQSDLPKLSNQTGQNGISDLPKLSSLYRQSSDQAETKQKNEPASPTPSFEKVKSKIFKDYERKLGREITWREGPKAEEAALEGLIQTHTPVEIVLAHRKYLETADKWERTRGYPFCSFAKKMDQYLASEDDEENSAVDDRPPTYDPINRPLRSTKVPVQ